MVSRGNSEHPIVFSILQALSSSPFTFPQGFCATGSFEPVVGFDLKEVPMISTVLSSLNGPSVFLVSAIPKNNVILSKRITVSRFHGFLSREGVLLPNHVSLLRESKERGFRLICSYNTKKKLEPRSPKGSTASNWPILERWDVPWKWQTVILTMTACGLSFVLTGLVEASFLPFLGFQAGELTLDEKAEILFAGQFIVTAVVLGVVYGITNSFRPLPDDIFYYGYELTSQKFLGETATLSSGPFLFGLAYMATIFIFFNELLACLTVNDTGFSFSLDVKEPFNLRNGWLLWAVISFVGALFAIALTGAGMSVFNGENPQRETDALTGLLPLIGSSTVSTACLVGITGLLAPLLEETVFRGFLMVSLTKWFPTPVSVLLCAAVFALAHLTPGEFPQLFVLGAALGFSYAQTRNLLTPITIHALWNSGVILLLTFLQLQGYDIRELLQKS